MSVQDKKTLKEVERNGLLFTFVYEANYDEQPRTKNVYQTDAVSLGDILQKFEEFLRGCGFSFEGELDFVDNKL